MGEGPQAVICLSRDRGGTAAGIAEQYGWVVASCEGSQVFDTAMAAAALFDSRCQDPSACPPIARRQCLPARPPAHVATWALSCHVERLTDQEAAATGGRAPCAGIARSLAVLQLTTLEALLRSRRRRAAGGLSDAAGLLGCGGCRSGPRAARSGCCRSSAAVPLLLLRAARAVAKRLRLRLRARLRLRPRARRRPGLERGGGSSVPAAGFGGRRACRRRRRGGVALARRAWAMAQCRRGAARRRRYSGRAAGQEPGAARGARGATSR